MMKYRADIDGLRAVAVLLVIFFHFQIAPFTGGYVGVDVFFVISGYLITNLILADLRSGKFSFTYFYERRVRRILPALFLVCVVTSAFALTLFMPDELMRFGKSMISVALFSSNFYFLGEADYFDIPETYKPLIHTWSLSVEEQFYILFPVFLFALYRWGSAARLPIIVLVIGACSFGLSLYLTRYFPSAAFYLLPARAVELLMGAYLAAQPIQRLPLWCQQILGIAAVAMIGIAAIHYDPTTQFPGIAAILPCLGAAILIYVGQDRIALVTRILSLRLFVSLGLISYSLYLWHWPIYVLARYYVTRDLLATERAMLLLASVMLACLSWRFVEQPIRRGTLLQPRRRLFEFAGATSVAIIALGSLLAATQGLPQRLPADIVAVTDRSAYLHQYRHCHSRDPSHYERFDVCKIGDASSPPSFLIWGDSHADMLVPAIAEAAALTGRSGVVFTSAGCAPEIGTRPIRGQNDSCRRLQVSVIAYLRQNYEIRDVVLAGYWRRQSTGATETSAGAFRVDNESREVSVAETLAVFRRGLSRVIQELPCRNVYFIQDIPEFAFSPPNMVARHMFLGRPLDETKSAKSLSKYRAEQAEADGVLTELASQSGATWVPIDDILCAATEATPGRTQERYCPVIHKKRILYRNGDHLSEDGAAMLVSRFEDVLAGKLLLASDKNKWETCSAPALPDLRGRSPT